MSFDTTQQGAHPVTQMTPDTPADLDICEQEPLAFSGQIQDVGGLIATRPEDHNVCYISDNLERWFDLPQDPSRATLDSFFADNCDYFVHRQRSIFNGKHFLIANVLTNRGVEGDLILSTGASLHVYEFEPKPAEDRSKDEPGTADFVVDPDKFSAAIAIEQIIRRVHELTHFPKIMLYQFVDGGAGEVVAELSDKSLDSYQGLRFPASDIPQIARALYIDNPFRLIFDTRSANSAVTGLQPDCAERPDLALSTLRSVSPVHIEYLGNMGVRSSVSFPVVVMGRLWGLLALHAVEATTIPVSQRIAVTELIEQQLARSLMNAKITEEHSRFNNNAERLRLSARALIRISNGETDCEIPAGFFELITCNAVCLVVNDSLLHRDPLITDAEAREILTVARQQATRNVFSTDSLLRFMPQDDDLRQRASGALYCSGGKRAGKSTVEILWLRSEQTHNINWAGRPEKTRQMIDGETRISPRQSFESWSAEIRGHSAAWESSDLMIATKLMVAVITESTS
jgi:light-regulated signal transduction histidine kinase (bacteriophytochrome)